MSTHLRSWIVLLAFGACICSASARVFGDAQAPAPQPAVTTDVVYGYKDDGLALMLDVYRSARPNGAGVIAIASGYWQSGVELAQVFAQAAPPLNEKGFTVFVVRHGSRPRYPLSSVVADVRRSVRFIHQHAKEYGVDPNRIGVFGNSSGGHLALLLGTTGDSGNPSASDPVLRESSRVAAGVAASFIPIRGAGHGFDGADAERAFAALIQWFEQHLGVQPVADAAAAAARDGEAELRAAEELREQQRQARIAELRQRFVDGPVFVMACGGSGTSNSVGAVVIAGAGTVYFNSYRPLGTLRHAHGGERRPGGPRWGVAASASARTRRRCDDLRGRVDV